MKQTGKLNRFICSKTQRCHRGDVSLMNLVFVSLVFSVCGEEAQQDSGETERSCRETGGIRGQTTNEGMEGKKKKRPLHLLGSANFVVDFVVIELNG